MLSVGLRTQNDTRIVSNELKRSVLSEEHTIDGHDRKKMTWTPFVGWHFPSC